MEIECNKITPDILKSVVSKKYDVPVENVIVEDIKLSPGSKKGDGFACDIASVVFRAKFSDQEVEENFIAKYAPDGYRSVMLKQMLAFDQEDQAYMWLIPQLQDLRAKAGLKPLAFARCFYSSVEDQILLLENLKLDNFQVIEKKPEPLSVSGVKLVLKELAAFHATSYAFIRTYPGGVDALAKEHPDMFTIDPFKDKEYAEEMFKGFVDMITKTFQSCALVVKKYESEELGDKMLECQKSISQTFEKMYQGTSKVNFVIHGDSWYNNFLFKFDDERNPVALKIVDLQITRLGRPGLELAYFFCSSTSPQQRKDHFDEFLKFYYDELCYNVTTLDQSLDFSFEELKDEYEDCYKYGFMMGSMHSQALLINEESDYTFDMEAMSDETARAKMYEKMEADFMAKVEASPNYRNLVIGLAREAKEKGAI